MTSEEELDYLSKVVTALQAEKAPEKYYKKLLTKMKKLEEECESKQKSN